MDSIASRTPTITFVVENITEGAQNATDLHEFDHVDESWGCLVYYNEDELHALLFVPKNVSTRTAFSNMDVRLARGDLMHYPPTSMMKLGESTNPLLKNKLNPNDLFYTMVIRLISLDEFGKFCAHGRCTIEFIFPLPADPMTKLGNAVYTDVKVACNDPTADMFNCNKYLIVLKSEVMRKAFANPLTKESQTGIFTMGHPCATYEVTQLFLKAIYEGWCSREMDTSAAHLLILADCYQSDSLVHSAVISIKRNLSTEGFWTSVRVAVLFQLQHPTLLRLCAKFADALPNRLIELLLRDDRGTDVEIGRLIVAVSQIADMIPQVDPILPTPPNAQIPPPIVNLPTMPISPTTRTLDMSFAADRVATTSASMLERLTTFVHVGHTWEVGVLCTFGELAVYVRDTPDTMNDLPIEWSVRIVNDKMEQFVPNSPPTFLAHSVALKMNVGFKGIIGWDQLAEFCTNAPQGGTRGRFTLRLAFSDIAGAVPMPWTTLETAMLTDVTVMYMDDDTTAIRCNKAIICRESEAMSSAFSDHLSEASMTKCFHIRHDLATPENTRLFIECMYENWQPAMDKHAGDILVLAVAYKCQRIAETAVESLNRCLTLNSFWETVAIGIVVRQEHAGVLRSCAVFLDALPPGGFADFVNQLVNRCLQLVNRANCGNYETIGVLFNLVADLAKNK